MDAIFGLIITLGLIFLLIVWGAYIESLPEDNEPRF